MIDFSTLKLLDYLIILLIFISSVYGFYHSLIKSMLSLLGWIAAIIFTYRLFPSVKAILATYISSNTLVVIVGNSLLLLSLLLCFTLINSLIYKLASNSNQSVMDRLMGLMFGILKSLLIVSFLFFSYSISLKLILSKQEPLQQKDYHNFIAKAQLFKILEKTNYYFETMFPLSFYTKSLEITSINYSTDNNQKLIQIYVEKLSSFASNSQIKYINYKRQEQFAITTKQNINLMTLDILYDIYLALLATGTEQRLLEEDVLKIEMLLKTKY